MPILIYKLHCQKSKYIKLINTSIFIRIYDIFARSITDITAFGSVELKKKLYIIDYNSSYNLHFPGRYLIISNFQKQLLLQVGIKRPSQCGHLIYTYSHCPNVTLQVITTDLGKSWSFFLVFDFRRMYINQHLTFGKLLNLMIVQMISFTSVKFFPFFFKYKNI